MSGFSDSKPAADGFEPAAERAKNLKLPDEQRLQLYGCYKQASPRSARPRVARRARLF